MIVIHYKSEGKPQKIEIDGAISESHKLSADVTKDRVESGSTFNDNIQNDPIEVTLECLVSDTPLGDMVGIRHGQEGLPSEAVRAQLKAIRAARQPVSIETAGDVYESMAMGDLEYTYDADTGHALKFSVTFTEFVIISNQRTIVRVATPSIAGKVKKAGPPIVLVQGTGGFTTKTGQRAVFNAAKGRYEYGDTKAHPDAPDIFHLKTGETPNGTPVPASDFPAAKPDTPGNSTYFDQDADEWRNTDGSSVTQTQTDAKQSPGQPLIGQPPSDDTDAFWNKFDDAHTSKLGQ